MASSTKEQTWRTTFRTHATINFRPSVDIGRRSAMRRNLLQEDSARYLVSLLTMWVSFLIDSYRNRGSIPLLLISPFFLYTVPLIQSLRHRTFNWYHENWHSAPLRYCVTFDLNDLKKRRLSWHHRWTRESPTAQHLPEGSIPRQQPWSNQLLYHPKTVGIPLQHHQDFFFLTRKQGNKR